MSCALASPDNGVCANRRPVRGRRAEQRPEAPVQASLVPLAEGHAAPAPASAPASAPAQVPTPRRATPQGVAPAAAVPAPAASQATAAHAPFGASAPESTFSLTQVREVAAPRVAASRRERAVEQTVRAAPPSFREIRSGRAAAASRAPVAEVRIPVTELDGGSFETVAMPAPAQVALPGMEQLVERVRQRTAARLSRSGAAFTPA